MSIKKFETVSKSRNETKQGVINGNTVVLSWNYEDGKLPGAVAFSVARGKQGDENFNGNQIYQGQVDNNDFVNIMPMSNFEVGDYIMIEEIVKIAKEVLNGNA